jgi:hypothetical protein
MSKSWGLLTVSAALFLVQVAQAGPTLFSSGYSLPETITPVPAGFGSYGGGYFVDDLGGSGGNSTTWYVPASGGAPSAVATSQGLPTGQTFWRGGTFLPANFGPAGGQYLFTTLTGLMTMNSSGALAPFVNTSGAGITNLTTPVVAPSSFGAYGGQVFATAQLSPTPNVGSVVAVTPNGSFTNFVNLPGEPYGLAFAPSNFGKAAGQMLVSDSGSGNLYAVTSSGQSSLFATLPFNGQGGLRQMAFSGSDFGRFSNDLFVSVSASSFGGGQLGSILVLNGSGTVIGTYLAGSQATAFDPRGITFIGNGEVLISDASDPLYLASISDFRVVPEPTTLVNCLVGAGALLGFGRFRRRTPSPAV